MPRSKRVGGRAPRRREHRVHRLRRDRPQRLLVAVERPALDDRLGEVHARLGDAALAHRRARVVARLSVGAELPRAARVARRRLPVVRRLAAVLDRAVLAVLVAALADAELRVGPHPVAHHGVLHHLAVRRGLRAERAGRHAAVTPVVGGHRAVRIRHQLPGVEAVHKRPLGGARVRLAICPITSPPAGVDIGGRDAALPVRKSMHHAERGGRGVGGREADIAIRHHPARVSRS
jgi:hypothetical protein